jgi:hypothetical protein
MDKGWVLSLIYPAIIDFDKSIREVSEHQASRRWRLERHLAESSTSGKPGAADGFDQTRSRHQLA